MGIKNEDEKKDAQIGFRITRTQKRRLDAVVQRVKSKDKRVEATEIYMELMGFIEPELITDEDRDFLCGRIKHKGTG
jgi:hypothetical protein